MKKFNKIIVMILMIALSIGSFFISPITAVLAGATTIGAAITLTKVPTTAKMDGRGVTIPLGSTTAAGGTVTVSIKNPLGKEIYKGTGSNLPSSTWKVEDGKLTFIPTMIGDYKVQYTSKADGYISVVSEEYVISVTGTKPVLTFETNTKNIIPATIGYKNSQDQVYKITLPNATVTDYQVSTGEEKTIELGKVSSESVSSEDLAKLNSNTLTNEDVERLIGYSVSVTDALHQAVDISYKIEKTQVAEDTYEYTINYQVSPVENVYGTYTVVYTYTSDLGSGLSTSKKFTFEVKKHFVEKTELTFDWENGKTMPETAVLGNEVNLPKPVVSNSNGTKVDAYTKVGVYFVEANATKNFTTWEAADAGNTKGWTAMPVEDFTFVAKNKATDGAHYLVNYQITDFFGNTVSKQYTIKNVYDSEKPVVYAVNAYTNSEDVDIENQIKNTIPVKVATNQTVKLPAIYATDNSTNSTLEDKSITLTRRYVYNSQNVNFKDSGLIQDDILDNQIALFTPTSAGTYTFYYEAKDSSNNTASAYKFVIEVEDHYEDTIAPVITTPTVTNVAYENETITFEAPSAVDYKNEEHTEVLQANIETTVSYYYIEQDGITKTEKTKLEANEDGTYSLKIEDNNYSKAVLVFEAQDMAEYSASSTTNNVAKEEIVIDIKNISNDTVAPKVDESTLPTTDTFTQSQDKLVGGVVFNDDSNVNVSIRISTPKFIEGTGYDYTDIENVILPSGKRIVKTKNDSSAEFDYSFKVEEAKFTSYHVGEHVVTLTATDSNGNTTIVAYTVQVTRSITPSIDSIKSIPATVEVGREITLPTGIVRDYNGEIVKYSQDTNGDYVFVDNQYVLYNASEHTGLTRYSRVEVEIEYINETPDGANGNKFKTSTPGTFTFKYKAVVDGQTIYSSLKTIVASDTLAPVIELLDDAWEESSTQSSPLGYKEDTVGEFVKVSDEFVKYDSSNTEHQSLTRYSYNVEIPAYTVTDAHYKDGELIGQNDIVEHSVKVLKGTKTYLEVINFEKSDDSTLSFKPDGDGEYKVIYSATDAAGTVQTREFILKVGDCEDPTLTLNNAQVVKENAKVGDVLKIDLNVITLQDKDETYDVLNSITNSGDVKFEIKITTPKKEEVTLSTNNEEYYSSEDKTFNYTLSEAGTYKVTYILTDKAGNTDEIEKTITVASKNSTSIISEKAWGTILVVASVALLAGVVVYFAVTNKKYSSQERKSK